MTTTQQAMLMDLGQAKERRLIKSVSYDQIQIMQDILQLYAPEGIELDPTYSVGNFYGRIPRPKYRYDINPQVPEVTQADCRKLPHTDCSINCINYDPPFIVGLPAEGVESSSMIADRFGRFKNIAELWAFYEASLIEFYRVLVPKGILIVKCQDTVSSGKQYLSHVAIINYAESIGFNCLDLFVLLARTRLIGENHTEQQHARKFHSYFLVFRKNNDLNKMFL